MTKLAKLCSGVLAFLALAGVCHASPDAKQALARLHALTSSISTLRCTFTQRTDIQLFAEPVLSKGKMLFNAPNKLVWEITEPVQEGLVLNGNSGYRWEDNKKRRHSFRTADDPLAALISKQILVWITFDQKSLLSRYSISVEAEEPLGLLLTPKNSKSASTVKSLRITFNEMGVASAVELQEAKGNNTSIWFENIHVNESIDDKEFE